MATAWKEPDPLRRRAGLLSSLSRVYNEAERLMNFNGSHEEVEQVRAKIEQRYSAYLESHEATLAEYPEREPTLVTSHDLNDKRYELILNNLAAYVKDGSKPEDDLESLHAASLFSTRTASRKTVSSVKHSSERSQASNQILAGRLQSTVKKTRANMRHHTAQRTVSVTVRSHY